MQRVGPSYRMALAFAVTVCITLAIPNAAAAITAITNGNVYVATRVSKPPSVDPSLDDPSWKTGLVATDFTNLTTRSKASLETRVSLLYTDSALYVAFACDQHGLPIRARQQSNSVPVADDDAVSVTIDTSQNGNQVYAFVLTPLGTRYQTASESSNYAPLWHGYVKRTSTGWNAVMVIPLKALRATGGSHAWRINFMRQVAALPARFSWAYNQLMYDVPISYAYSSYSRFWHVVHGFDLSALATRPLPHAEFYTLNSTGSDHDVFLLTNGAMVNQRARVAGVDLTYPFSNTMAFVATLNPDFSNVESDQLTIAPHEFPQFFQETRPFFAQGAQFFSQRSSNSLFYSPNIPTFSRGEKIEGTFGDQALGILNVHGEGFDDSVFSLSHSVANRSFQWWTQAVSAHHADGNDLATSYGVNGLDEKSGLSWSLARSQDRGSFTADQSLATDSWASVGLRKPTYGFYLDYEDTGPYFSPRDGYVYQNDARGFDLSGMVGKAYGQVGLSFSFTGQRLFDRSGALKSSLGGLAVSEQLTPKLGIYVSRFLNNLRSYSVGYPQYIGGVTLPYDQTSASLYYGQNGGSQFSASYSAAPFATFYLQQFNVSASRNLGAGFSAGVDLDATHERSDAIGVQGQILRRLTLSRSLGSETDLLLSLRSISGAGTFEANGTNVAAALHHRFRNRNDVYMEYGTPASATTLHRLILKYIFRVGGGAGT